jgi:hypothetical protein
LVDFKERLADKQAEKPTDPVKLYETLDRAHDKGPLRPAQMAVLKSWFEDRQGTRDIIPTVESSDNDPPVRLGRVSLAPNSTLVSAPSTSEGVDRRLLGTAPTRRGWKKHQVAALNGHCEVESCGIYFKQSGARRHIDHIVSARLIRKLRAGNPDHRENLECICETCHGYKLQANYKLCLAPPLLVLQDRNFHSLAGPKNRGTSK